MRYPFVLFAVAVVGSFLAAPSRGGVVLGPVEDYRDVIPGNTGSTDFTITINTRLSKRITDQIIISIPIGSSDRAIGGIGYIIDTPGQPVGTSYDVVTIYGLDANPASPTLSLNGLSTTSPQFSMVGPENITGLDGIVYHSNGGEELPKESLEAFATAHGGLDTTPLNGADAGTQFYAFETTLPPEAAVPEPSSLALIGGGILAVTALRRRRV